MPAQTITLGIPLAAGDSVSAAPPITVTANGVPPEAGPVTVQLELFRDQTLQTPFFVQARQAAQFTFALPQLLPERTVVFFRATVLDQRGNLIARDVQSHPVRSWLRLVSPDRLVLFTRRPEFVWSPSPLSLPPGPWLFDLSVINTATNQVAFFAPGISATTFVFDQPLEANTSYKWRVRARALNSTAAEDVTVSSQSTFVIASAEQPTATIFYQNFPNPFPNQRSAVTCFWFDLAQRSLVRLTIYDIRLREVKNIIPGARASNLGAGAYGRQGDVTQAGCDLTLSWDGTDDRGHPVPRGVYLARFEADGYRETKKILFLGR